MLKRPTQNDSGQISILVLVAATALLAVTYAIGMFAQVIVAQQRLSNNAESIALAAAMELEFNSSNACVIAQQFSQENYNMGAKCSAYEQSVEIWLTEPNPNPFLNALIPIIKATARAEIVTGEWPNSVD